MKKVIFASMILLIGIALVSGGVLSSNDAQARPASPTADDLTNYEQAWHSALGHVVISRLPINQVREHLIHESGDRGALMHLYGSGGPMPSMPEDIGNWPWLGGICYGEGLVRCCYLPATGAFGRCKCYCTSNGCYWGFALPGE